MDVADYVLQGIPGEDAADYVKAVMPDVMLRLKEVFRQQK
jgi:hypothetical protein